MCISQSLLRKLYMMPQISLKERIIRWSNKGILHSSTFQAWNAYMCCVCLVAQLCPTLCDPIYYNLPSSSVHGYFPGKNTGVSCHVLFQGIFPTQGLNPGLLHCRWILYPLSHQGNQKCKYNGIIKIGDEKQIINRGHRQHWNSRLLGLGFFFFFFL